MDDEATYEAKVGTKKTSCKFRVKGIYDMKLRATISNIYLSYIILIYHVISIIITLDSIQCGS